MKRLFTLVACFIVAACAAPGPQTLTAAPVPLLMQNKTVQSELATTNANLNAAVTAGALPATDPAVVCSNQAMQAAGLSGTTTPPQQFTVNCNGGLSCGSISYIKARIALNAKPFTVDPGCLQLLGQFQVDAATAAANPLGTAETLLGIPQIKP